MNTILFAIEPVTVLVLIKVKATSGEIETSEAPASNLKLIFSTSFKIIGISYTPLTFAIGIDATLLPIGKLEIHRHSQNPIPAHTS